MKKISLLLFLIIYFQLNIFPQQELGGGWKLNGQIQLRTELDGRDFSNSTHPLTFASMRTRLGVEKSFEDVVSFLVQFQDSRIFGEEPSTLTSINNIDLHQGFIKLNNLFDWDWNIQAGRFEVAYGTERFIGAVGWHYVGRSFDGVRFTILPESWNLDLFGLTVYESDRYIGNATPFRYPNPSELSKRYSVYGFYKNFYLDNMNNLDLLGYYEANHQRTAGGAKIADMITVAGSYFGNYGNFRTTIETAYQFGKYIETRDINAYLISLVANYNFGISDLGAGVDILSGTEPNSTDKKTSFETTFGTNHKFYGYMDYFIEIPWNTNYLGLHDFYLKSSFVPDDSDWIFEAAVHHFMSNKSSAADQNTFGQELDLTIRYNLIKGTALSWGGSLFFPDELMKSYFGNEDVAYWTYLMITANI